MTELDLFPEWRMSLDLYKQAPPLPSTSLWEKPLETNDGLDAAGDPHPVFPLAGGGVRVPLLDYAALKTAVRAVCRCQVQALLLLSVNRSRLDVSQACANSLDTSSLQSQP